METIRVSGQCYSCDTEATIQRIVFHTRKFVCDRCNNVFNAGVAAGESCKTEELEQVKTELKQVKADLEQTKTQLDNTVR